MEEIIIRCESVRKRYKYEVLIGFLIKVIEAAPYDKLFPLVKAVVHHGDIGTTAACLRTKNVNPPNTSSILSGNLTIQQGFSSRGLLHNPPKSSTVVKFPLRKKGYRRKTGNLFFFQYFLLKISDIQKQ